jgi:hypothetical protein
MNPGHVRYSTPQEKMSTEHEMTDAEIDDLMTFGIDLTADLTTTDIPSLVNSALTTTRPFLATRLIENPALPPLPKLMLMYMYRPNSLDQFIVDWMIDMARDDEVMFPIMCRLVAYPTGTFNPVDLVRLVNGFSCLTVYEVTRDVNLVNLIKQFITLPDFHRYSAMMRSC